MRERKRGTTGVRRNGEGDGHGMKLRDGVCRRTVADGGVEAQGDGEGHRWQRRVE